MNKNGRDKPFTHCFPLPVNIGNTKVSVFEISSTPPIEYRDGPRTTKFQAFNFKIQDSFTKIDHDLAQNIIILLIFKGFIACHKANAQVIFLWWYSTTVESFHSRIFFINIDLFTKTTSAISGAKYTNTSMVRMLFDHCNAFGLSLTQRNKTHWCGQTGHRQQ